jgi:uncharacterized protein DUF4339
MESFVEFLVLLAFGAACAAIAGQRGRNPVAWFFLGFIFSCFGLILLLVLPDVQELEDRHKGTEDQSRRLREELAQERQRNQSFRGHVKARLDVHDAALEIDTREQTPVTELPAPPPPPSMAAQMDLPQEGWYVAEAGGSADGPLGLADMLARVEDGRLRKSSLIWNAEYEQEWVPLGDTPLAEGIV